MTELKKPRFFEEGHPASVFILEWWENLKQNKGDRAELRRCKNLEEIQMTSAYQRCYWQLKKQFEKENQILYRQPAAIVIGLAAHIEKKADQSDNQKSDFFGYQIGRGDKPKLSELRFRRLLKIKDRENLYHFFIQVIRMLDKKVNLLDLLSIAYFWGDKAKTSLAYKYYEKANLEAK